MAGEDPVREQLEALGEFIRSQRKQAQLSLRDLAERANVSNPYLSQIERGLHEPSVRVLKAIAGALNLSVETLLGRAGFLGGPPETESGPSATEHAILADPYLSDDQRASLLAVYRSYVDRVRQQRAESGLPGTDPAGKDADLVGADGESATGGQAADGGNGNGNGLNGQRPSGGQPVR